MTRAARVYLRVSDKRQEMQGVSLASQLARVEEYAAAHDLTIVAIYQDVLSGKRIDRAQYQRMLTDLAAGETVLVFDLDRTGRDVEEAFRMRRQVRERKAMLVVVNDPGVTENTLMFGMKSVFNAHLLEVIRAKVVPNMAHVVSVEHRWVSKPPTWYRMEPKPRVGKQRRVYAEGEGRLIPAEDYPGQAVACWEMVKRLGNIAAAARHFGLTRDALRGMVDNPAYVGDTRWHEPIGERGATRELYIRDTHPALVPHALWEEVRALCVRPHAVRRLADFSLLSGILYRADSAERLYHRLRNADTPYARRYYCAFVGPYVSVPAEDVEDAAIAQLATLNCSAAQARALITQAARDARRDPHAAERARIARALTAIDDARDEAIDALLRRAITDSDLAAARDRMAGQEAALLARRAALPPAPDPEAIGECAARRVGLAAVVRGLWQRHDPESLIILRDLLTLYYRRIEVWDAEVPGVYGKAKQTWYANHPPRLHFVSRP